MVSTYAYFGIFINYINTKKKKRYNKYGEENIGFDRIIANMICADQYFVQNENLTYSIVRLSVKNTNVFQTKLFGSPMRFINKTKIVEIFSTIR